MICLWKLLWPETSIQKKEHIDLKPLLHSLLRCIHVLTTFDFYWQTGHHWFFEAHRPLGQQRMAVEWGAEDHLIKRCFKELELLSSFIWLFYFCHVLGPWKAFSSTETMETAIALLRLLEILGATRDLRVKMKYEKPCKWLERFIRCYMMFFLMILWQVCCFTL